MTFRRIKRFKWPTTENENRGNKIQSTDFHRNLSDQRDVERSLGLGNISAMICFRLRFHWLVCYQCTCREEVCRFVLRSAVSAWFVITLCSIPLHCTHLSSIQITNTEVQLHLYKLTIYYQIPNVYRLDPAITRWLFSALHIAS
jgi:hypothetical protein